MCTEWNDGLDDKFADGEGEGCNIAMLPSYHRYQHGTAVISFISELNLGDQW